MTYSWRAGLVTAVLCLTAASPAGAAVITFDDLDAPAPGGAGLLVNTQYEDQGVTFGDVRAFEYAPGFAHSPDVGVEQCVGVEACTSPVRATFSTGQDRVKVWVGFNFKIESPLGVRLTAFDAGSAVVGTADAVLAANPNPTPISVPLEVDLAEAVIRRLEVAVSSGEGYTAALAVDDVEFSSPGPPPPCGAPAPPAVTLTQPANGLVVDEDSFPLAGSVDGRGATITGASVHARGSGSVYPALIASAGGPFGPTRFGGLLGLGVNEVRVSATNCAGTGSSEPRTVIRTVAQPGPYPAACVPQLDHPDVHVATSAEDLVATLADPSFQGQVVVPRGADFDLDGYAYVPLRPGVQLVGERDALGRRPRLHVEGLDDFPLFVAAAGDVCVEGIHFEGPSRATTANLPKVFGIQVIEDPAIFHSPLDAVVIADNEFAGWTGAAVAVEGTVDFGALDPTRVAPAGYAGPRMLRSDAAQVRVERNYIHHNTRSGAGYGVMIGGSAYAEATGNTFDFNRHSVTSEGQSFSGYVARFNYGLEGGYRYGGNGYFGPHFDVHGTGSPKKWIGGIAGEFHEISSNTIRGDQEYECRISCSTRPVLTLRGRSTAGLFLLDNVVEQEPGETVLLKRGSDSSLDISRPATFGLVARRNRYDTDRSRKLATGDFDGDGRTDVFVSTGTAWFMSRAGIRPWEFLRASTVLTDDLGFADVDGDGATDVLQRGPDGALEHLRSGIGDPVRLTDAPVAVRRMRFGDFDGDGRADAFFTEDGRWQVWHAATGAWTPTQSSNVPLGRLLFGEFDGARGTDVAAVVNRRWSYSSAARLPWARLNARLRPSFAGAVAADFDGNGRTDIAFDESGTWRYSPDGAKPMARLRRKEGQVGALHRLLVGNFDGQPRVKVVAYGPSNRLRFGIWRGLGSDADFKKHSEQNMR